MSNKIPESAAFSTTIILEWWVVGHCLQNKFRKAGRIFSVDVHASSRHIFPLSIQTKDVRGSKNAL
jgi:hypothetical protein